MTATNARQCSWIESLHARDDWFRRQIGQAKAALACFTRGAGKTEKFEITAPVRPQILHVLRQGDAQMVMPDI